MGLLIRRLGIGIAMRITGKKLALAQYKSMTLIEVKQKNKESVKKRARGRVLRPSSIGRPLITTVADRLCGTPVADRLCGGNRGLQTPEKLPKQRSLQARDRATQSKFSCMTKAASRSEKAPA